VARSNSVINVSIIGDAKKLISAVGDADKATGGLVKSGLKVAGGAIAVRKGFDLLNDSLAEADRRGDAIQRLERSIGKIDTGKLTKSADDFTKIGASSQDMLELEAAYADLATSAGIAQPDIAANAESMAVAALAAAQVHDEDPSTIIDAIGKAAGGSTRGLKPYGVDLTDAAVQQDAMRETGKTLPGQLTDTELATARVNLMLEAFSPLVQDATTGTGDFAQNQDELGAKVETVGGKIGAQVAGPLTDILGFINDEIDAMPGAIEGWGLLGDAINQFGANSVAPLARVNDALLNIVANLAKAVDLSGFANAPADFFFGNGNKDRDIAAAIKRERERNGLGN